MTHHIMHLCLAVMFLVGCADPDMVVEGFPGSSEDDPSYTTTGGHVTTEELGPSYTLTGSECDDDGDCSYGRLCLPMSAASDKEDVYMKACLPACERQVASNSDGSISVVFDSCQRYGDQATCNDTTHQCDCWGVCASNDGAVPKQEPVIVVIYGDPGSTPTDPTDPDPTPAADEKVVVECCYYNQDMAGYYGVFSYSTSTTSDPEGWKHVRDLSIGTDGCFQASIDWTEVFLFGWTDVTYGPTKGKHPADIVWAGTSRTPSECFVDGQSVPIGAFDNGLASGTPGHPIYDAVK